MGEELKARLRRLRWASRGRTRRRPHRRSDRARLSPFSLQIPSRQNHSGESREHQQEGRRKKNKKVFPEFQGLSHLRETVKRCSELQITSAVCERPTGPQSGQGKRKTAPIPVEMVAFGARTVNRCPFSMQIPNPDDILPIL